MDPTEKNLLPDQMERMRQLFVHTPMVQMCRNTIQRYLLSNGIAVKTGKRARDESMRPFLDEWWVPFCADVIDSVICYGLVAVYIKTLDTGQQVPTVMVPGSYTIRFKIVENAFEYRVFADRSTEPLENAYVYDDFGFQPRRDGSVASLMESLMPHIGFIDILKEAAVEMEALRRRPLLYTETHDRTHTGPDREGIDYDFYADADMQEGENAAKFHRNSAQLEQLEQQQQLLSTFHENKRITDYQHDALSNLVALPEGAKVVSVAQGTGRGDIGSLNKSMEDNICGVLGVPRSMLMSDTPHKADTEGTHRMFQQTIAWWSRHLSKMCEHVYNIIHADEVKKKVMERAAKRAKRTTGDLYAIRQQVQVRFSFPVTPLLGRKDLQELYHQKILPWETYYSLVMGNLGLAYDKIPPEPAAAPAPQKEPPAREKADRDDDKDKDKDKEDEEENEDSN